MTFPRSPSSPTLSTSDKRIEPPKETSPLLARTPMHRVGYSSNTLAELSDRVPLDGPQSARLPLGPSPDYREQLRRKSISMLEMTRQMSGQMPGQQAQKPFFERLLSNRATVSNPNSSALDLSSPTLFNPDPESARSPDLEMNAELDPKQRMSILSVLRPEKLIGSYKVVADWTDRLVDLGGVRKRKLKKFYEEQNELIERYAEIDHLLDYGKIHLNMLLTYTEPKLQNVPDDEALVGFSSATGMAKLNSKSRLNASPGNIQDGGHFNEELLSREVYMAILFNFFINFLLLIGKVAIAFLTDSLSIVASLVDSILDFLSTFIIYIANRLSTTKNWRTQLSYPIGRAKLEPLGILIFSTIIIISFFQVGLESFKKLFLSGPDQHDIVVIKGDAILIMLITISAKVGCWLWCKRSKSSSVQALSQDAVTDIVFNTVSLIMPTAGNFFKIWWLDPLGAFLLSLYVIVSWSMTAYEHIDNLTGAVADPMDYKVILYMAYRFAECIKLVTALKVYHAGDLLNVEIDLVFNTKDFNLSFKDAHDIAEALQYAIETLPMVERAYVHIDYMEGNFQGHLT